MAEVGIGGGVGLYELVPLRPLIGLEIVEEVLLIAILILELLIVGLGLLHGL
jgi:hypothetical protein